MKVRPRGGGIFGAIQVLRVQYGVAIGEPFGGVSMEPAPLVLKERGVHAFLDQSMGEQVFVALGADEVTLDQLGARIFGVVHQSLQRIQCEPLTDGRGRLQRPLVAFRKPVNTRQDQTLDRGWHVFVPVLFNVSQKLLEKQRVAAGSGNRGKSPGDFSF